MTKYNEVSQLLTTRELADYLRVSVSCLEKQRSCGKAHPTYTRIGRRILYELQDVQDFLSANEVNTNTTTGVEQ